MFNRSKEHKNLHKWEMGKSGTEVIKANSLVHLLKIPLYLSLTLVETAMTLYINHECLFFLKFYWNDLIYLINESLV